MFTVAMQVNGHYRAGRKKPWEARWWVHRRMRSKFFETEKERDRFILEFSRELAQQGEEVFKFDKDRMRRWQIADELVPAVDPVELAQYWLEHHPQQVEQTVSQALAAYLDHMKLAGRDKSYRQHATKAFKRFEAGFGAESIGNIESPEERRAA